MSQSRLASLAVELVVSLNPSLSGDRQKLLQTRDHVIHEIKADAHGGSRREWHDIDRQLSGCVNEDRSVLGSHSLQFGQHRKNPGTDESGGWFR